MSPAARSGLQYIHDQLTQARQTILTALESGLLDTKDQVDLAQLLWRIVNEAQATLDPIKVSLRDVACERQDGRPGRQFLHGRTKDARCTVVVPQPKVQLRPGTDVAQLKQLLGESFSVFFTESVRPRADFAEQATLHPEFLTILADAVDTAADTPRVSFND